MIDDREKLDKMLSDIDMKPEDLAEHPDDRFEEEIDEYERMVKLLEARGFIVAASTVAAQLLLSIRLGEVEMAITTANDNLMLHLETGGNLPMKIPSTEELLKKYNPEILECIKDGDAEMEIYDDRVVITKPIKPDA